MAYIEDRALREKVVEFIASAGFEDVFYRLQAVRVGVALVGRSTEWDRAAMARIDAFSRAYRWILRKIVESGYNPEKNKNDFNDLHFLLYLADPQLVLVSRDGGIARKVGPDSSQGERIRTFEDWLAS